MAIEFLRNFKLDGRLRANVLDVETGKCDLSNQIGFFEIYIWRRRFTFVAIFYQICTLCLWLNNNSVVAQNEDKKPFEQSPNGDKSVDMLFL